MSQVKEFDNLLKNYKNLYPQELARETKRVILAYKQLAEETSKTSDIKQANSNDSKSFETKNKVIQIIKQKLADRDQEMAEIKERYEKEITNLQAIVQMERKSYNQEVTSLQAKISELDSQIAQAHSVAIEQDSQEIERLKHKLSSTEEALIHARAKHEEADLQITRFSNIKDELEQKYLQEKAQASKLCEVLSNKEHNHSRLIDELKIQLEEKEDSLNVLRNEYQNLEFKYLENQTNQRHSSELLDNRKLEDVLDELEKLNSEICEYRNNNWKGQYFALESDYNDMLCRHQNEQETLGKNYRLLKITSESQGDMISQLRNECHEQESKIQDNQKTLENLKTAISDFEKIISKKESDYNDLLGEKDKLLEKCEKLEKTAKDSINIEAELEVIRRELNTLRNQYQESCLNVHRLAIEKKEITESLEYKLQKLEKELADKDSQHALSKLVYEKELEHRDAMIESSRGNLSVLEKNCQGLNKSNKFLAEQLEDNEKLIKELKSQLVYFKSVDVENDRLLEMIKNLEEEKDKEISTTKEALHQVSEKYNLLSDEMKKLTEQLEKMNMKQSGWDMVESETDVETEVETEVEEDDDDLPPPLVDDGDEPSNEKPPVKKSGFLGLF